MTLKRGRQNRRGNLGNVMKIQHTNFLSLWVLTLGWALTCTGTAQAQAQAQTKAQTQQYIPHHLLGLIHAPEVHRELKLTQGQVDQLENLFDQIDGQWWRSRNLKPDENAAVILKLEETVDDWFRSNGTAVQQHRLQQLVLWSQGTRMLLRKDVKQK